MPPIWPDKEHLVARWLARQFLRFAEFVFLFAYGWRRIPRGWKSPEGYPTPKAWYDRGHALNSTKYYLREAAMTEAMEERFRARAKED